MFLIALVTAGSINSSPVATTPGVPAPIVFARPAPPPVKKPAKPAAAPALAQGVPTGPFVCYQYIVNPVFDPKYQTIVNAGISQAGCINAPPGAPVEP